MKSFLTLLFLLSAVCIVSNAQAEVYKHTNPDGSVTFSDVPDKINAKPIQLQPSSTYKAPPLPESVFKPRAKKPASTNYESVSITSPENDKAIRDNTGNLTISISVKPGLQSGHSYVVLMDGKNAGEGKESNIALSNVPRGSHTFVAQVVDENKKVILQSSPVVVHLQRYFIPPG